MSDADNLEKRVLAARVATDDVDTELFEQTRYKLLGMARGEVRPVSRAIDDLLDKRLRVPVPS